jgi:hypothetical protein
MGQHKEFMMPILRLEIEIERFEHVAELVTAIKLTGANAKVIVASYVDKDSAPALQTNLARPRRPHLNRMSKLGEQLLTWMKANPGPHRVRDVAEALFPDAKPEHVQRVANQFASLDRSGHHLRKVQYGVYEAIDIGQEAAKP